MSDEIQDLIETVDRVLHDMGNPHPKESKQWLREFAQNVMKTRAAPKVERGAQQARTDALEEAAQLAEVAPYKRKAMICGCSEGLANYIANEIRALMEDAS